MDVSDGKSVDFGMLVKHLRKELGKEIEVQFYHLSFAYILTVSELRYLTRTWRMNMS